MKTAFLTSVSATFNPFLRSQRTARLFLTLLPPDARATMKISVAQLPRSSNERGGLKLAFKDGKEMAFDPEKIKLSEVIEQVDRHSRMLARKEDLSAS